MYDRAKPGPWLLHVTASPFPEHGLLRNACADVDSHCVAGASEIAIDMPRPCGTEASRGRLRSPPARSASSPALVRLVPTPEHGAIQRRRINLSTAMPSPTSGQRAPDRASGTSASRSVPGASRMSKGKQEEVDRRRRIIRHFPIASHAALLVRTALGSTSATSSFRSSAMNEATGFRSSQVNGPLESAFK